MIMVGPRKFLPLTFRIADRPKQIQLLSNKACNLDRWGCRAHQGTNWHSQDKLASPRYPKSNYRLAWNQWHQSTSLRDLKKNESKESSFKITL